MQYLFSVDGDIGLKDGFYQAFPVFAKTARAVYVFAEAGDDVVVVDCCCNVRGGVFRDELFVTRAAEIAFEKTGGGGLADDLVFGVCAFEILVADA